MYVFTSAFFFLIYFSFISKHQEIRKGGIQQLKEDIENKKEGLAGLNEMLEKSDDAVLKDAAGKTIVQYENELKLLTDRLVKKEAAEQQERQTKSAVPHAVITELPSSGDIKKNTDSVKNAAMKKEDGVDEKKGINMNLEIMEWYKNEDMYRDIQDKLPAERRDGLIIRAIKLKAIHWFGSKKKDTDRSLQVLSDKFKHSFPTMLFISLPFFALFLKLLYIRKSKYYYADHGIFAIHTYSALFVLMLLYYLLDGIAAQLHWWIFSLAKTAMIIYMLYYVYKAMKNLYGQSRAKTLLKYFLLSCMTLMIMGVLIILFLVISAYRV